jgi:DNA-binding NtrC family response regulator
VIAATNKDLAREAEDGGFREDLYYRLAVVVLSTPPLRDHRDDIVLLVGHFTDQFCQEYNRRPKSWSKAAIDQMKGHRWPGNVRELKNVVERAVIMELDDTIDRAVVVDGPGSDTGMAGLLDAPTLADFQRESEMAYLRHQLDRNRWNIAATARAIGTPRSNLYKKLQAYGIEREDS